MRLLYFRPRRTVYTMRAEPFHFVSGYVVWVAQSPTAAAVVRLMSLAGPDDKPQKAICGADLEDIRDSCNGDGQAYRRLIERHQDSVGKLLWRFTRDRTEHEELVQQVFVEAYFSLAGYAAKAPFAHWLARIATRIGYRYWNQQRKHTPVALPDEAWEHLAGPESQPAEVNETAEVVHRLLAKLPPRDRLVLTLRYLEQCDIAQVAYRLGWTQPRVRVQTHRALAKLKKILAENHIELDL